MTVLKTNLQEILLSAQGTANLDRRVRYMVQTMSNDGVLAVDKDSEDVIKLETPLSGVTDIVRQALEFLAALNRTPAVKLLGISPSGFNATGESDIRNYYDHITSQQEKVLRPGIRRALECVQLHEFRAIDRGLDFDFAPLGEEDRAALTTQQKTRADTVAVYLDRGVISAEEARAALAKDSDSPFADIDPEALPDGDAGDVPPGMEGEPGDVEDVDKAGAVYDAALDAREWRTTAKGKHFELETETGEITKGNIGQGEWDSPAAQGARRDKVEHALREIASGNAEATVPGLRNDLEQYGGTNDVTIIRGDAKKGLVHIERRHGTACIAPVLEAVANGKITRFSPNNNTVAIQKDGYEAILSLEEYRKKKTWLLTGYDIREDKKKESMDERGKLSQDTRLRNIGPSRSRPDMGAVNSFNERIGQLLEKSNLRASQKESASLPDPPGQTGGRPSKRTATRQSCHWKSTERKRRGC